MGAKWSKAEEAILIEVSQSGVTLLSQMHRLPGREWNAAKCHASRMGINLSGFVAWTPEERATLRDIWAGSLSIKVGMKRLPNRSYDAARAEAMRLGILGKRGRTGRIGYAFVKPAIEAALKDSSPLRADQLAKLTGATVRQINKVLSAGRGQTFRVDSWMRKSTFGDVAARWALGNSADAERPAPKTSAQCCREYNQRVLVRAGQFDPFASLVMQVAA
ncbi:hypothetical protein G3N58_15185 [Paraburkholderia sp. Ac-20342]|uniref:hypothetical protein n=1 Tax=Paraburkholderia sp. Ac-20342 TaxID=2703889 RepID=UPI0019801DC5|nr:hypothetical protein [Paraburkholderia sp. Ac-20342]MBN3848164.1 hypothetical protein [Paraburkholderia sp. Ac-20342]